MRDSLLRSPDQRTADQLLGRPVEHWIAERRAAGSSYDVIARDLFTETCGQVDVSGGSLAGWSEATGVARPGLISEQGIGRLHGLDGGR